MTPILTLTRKLDGKQMMVNLAHVAQMNPDTERLEPDCEIVYADNTVLLVTESLYEIDQAISNWYRSISYSMAHSAEEAKVEHKRGY